jgi:radial spoke head protein 4A
MSSLEATKQRLQQQDESGYSAYEHISEVLLKLVAEQPENALELFEHLSCQIKRARPSIPSSGGSDEEASRAAAVQWSANCLRLVTGDKDPETEEYIPPPEDAEEKLEDIVHATEDLEWAGVSLGEEETIRIKQAMVRTLGQNEDIEKIRFFGKFLGTNSDYYVFEATQDGVLNEDEENDNNFEALANRFAYYVANNVGEDFQRLPNVSADQVVGSMKIRTFLKGALSGAVAVHPPFPGTEAHLLRAIIARISGETTVAPDYQYSPAEVDEGEIAQEVQESEQMEDEDFVPPTIQTLAAQSVSRFRTIAPPHNPNGFIGTPQIPDPTDPESFIPDPNALKPQPAIRELSPSEWHVTQCNAKNVALRSLVWPGLTTLARQRSCVRIYIGFGMRSDGVGALKWAPQFPNSIVDEVDSSTITEQEDNNEKPPEPEPEPIEGEDGDEDADE